jgi:hypothetical protein
MALITSPESLLVCARHVAAVVLDKCYGCGDQIS